MVDVAALAREAMSATGDRRSGRPSGSSSGTTSLDHLPTPGDAVEQFLVLEEELRLYEQDLAHRPRVVVLNQVGSRDRGGIDVLCVCASASVCVDGCMRAAAATAAAAAALLLLPVAASPVFACACGYVVLLLMVVVVVVS